MDRDEKRRDASAQPMRVDRTAGVVAAVLFALGLLLRVWVLGRAPLTADQAVVGLMAREILHGHFFAFYWGQSYGGGEPYVVAALFALFGQSRVVLGLAPVLLDAVAALLVWRIGRRLFDTRVGVLAALLFWLWPEVYLYLSTVEYGFRYLALVCGLAVLLFALRIAGARPSRLRDWAGLGLFLGLGWWCTPEIVYYAVPALLWIAYRALQTRTWPRPAGVLAFIGATALGALPWLGANVGHGYPSFHQVAQQYTQAWAGRLGVFFQHVLPLVLGLRLRGSGAWLGGPALGLAAYVLLGLAVLAWTVRLAMSRRALPLVFFVVLFPFAYAYAPYSAFWNDGRYALYLAPVVALLAASGLRELARPSPRLARAAPVLGVAAALALTAAAALQLAPYQPAVGSQGPRSTWTTWSADPNRWVEPLATALERAHVRGAYAGYWVAYPLTFEARGGVVAADTRVNRYPPYLAAAEHSPRQAWVFARSAMLPALNAAAGTHPWFIDGSLTAADLQSYLKHHNIAFRVANAGFFTIVYPARAVVPGVVRRSMGTQAPRPQG